MAELLPPSPPQRPRRSASPILPLLLILAIFLIIVLIVSILLLPDKGKSLLKLTDAHPVTQTLPSAIEPGAIAQFAMGANV